MKILTSLVLCFSLTALAKNEFAEQYDYQKCQFNTNKLFQVGGQEGKAFPRIFQIDNRTNTLVPNTDHTALSMMDIDTGEYRFTKLSPQRIRLGGLRRYNSDPQGTQYNFIVKRDAQERILSISSVLDDGSKKTVNFEYSQKTCVASDVFYENNDEVELIADIVSCRSLSERYKNLFKKIKSANQCMRELGSFHDYLNDTTSALTKRLSQYQPRGTDGKKFNYKTDLYEHMDRMSKIAKDLKQTVSLKLSEEDLEDELSRAFSAVQNICFKNFTDKFLYKDKYFDTDRKGVMRIKAPARITLKTNSQITVIEQ